MSHSSGIGVSDGVRNNFGSAVTSGAVRLFKLQIDNETISEVTSKAGSSDWEADFALIPDLLDVDRPCYILYRLPDTPSGAASWALFCYVPDKSKVKDKMLYASSRANLKQQLGNNYFTDEVFGTVVGDFSLNGYHHHVQSKKVEAPLTEQEQIKNQEKTSGEIYSGGQSTYIHGVSFPVDVNVSNAVKELLKGGNTNYVRIAIDIEKERIILDSKSSIANFSLLSNEISTDEPRFHFYSYSHNFEGNNITSYVYIYSCPDGSNGTKSAPVKQRMLYSSSKANVGEIVSSVGGKVDARIEINSPVDLSEEEILNTLHPQKEEKKQSFSKPSRPGAGQRKLIRGEKKN